MSAPLEVFCCYAREDQALLENLRKHLMPLQRQGQIKIWSDTDINAGVDWEKELHRHLESADIILLLISADFMNSDYCYSTEMGRAMARHQQGSACVIPVILRSTLWQNAPFAELQVIPTDARPVKSWQDADDAFHDITKHINTVVAKLQEQRAREEAARQVQRELSRAKGYVLENRNQEDLVCYEQVLHLDQTNGAALFGKATMLYNLGQFDASIDAFTLAEQKAPADTSFSLYRLKAHALKHQKCPDESLAAFDQALSKYSRNGFLFSKASLYAEKASLLVEQKAFDQALTALEQARNLQPTQARYFEQTGELLFNLGRLEQALTMYEQASKLAPKKPGYYVWQGSILQLLKRDEDALAAYKRALAIKPLAEGYEEAGKTCLRLARYQEAMEWLPGANCALSLAI